MTRTSSHTLLLVVLLGLAMLMPTIACNKSSSSQFLKDIPKDQYAAVEGPAEAQTFRWDFSGSELLTYTYSQEIRNHSEMMSETMDQSMSSSARLKVQAHGDGSADVVMEVLKMEMDGTAAPASEFPSMTVTGMTEDGACPPSGDGEDLFIKLLFPLPDGPMAVGDSADVPAEMPFNAMDANVPVTGRSRLTLTRYVDIDGRTCAQFDVDIDISQLTMPADFEGSADCFATGKSVLYFDIERRRFVSGVMAVVLQFEIDSPLPEGMPEGIPDMPDRIEMAMTSDNLIRFSLVD
jgi:hypothetical protein